MKKSFASDGTYESNPTQMSQTSPQISSQSSKIKKQYDHLFKIVLIGDSGVGKSCILLRFADDQFNDNFYSTIGVDFWDTAGQERFKTITSAYYRGADGIIIVYDQTDKNSFFHLYDWLDDIDKLTTDNPVKMVIANKADLDNKVISEEDKKNFAKKTGIEIIETSAKKSFQVSDAFEKLTRMLIERAEKKNSNQLDQSYKLTPTPLEGRLSDNTVKCCK